MKIRIRRVLAAAIPLAMVCAFMPPWATPAFAAKMEGGLPSLVVTNKSNVGTLVGFVGEEWYVVGGTKDICLTAPGDSIILLVKGRHTEGYDRYQWTYDWSIYGSDMSQFSDGYWYKNNLNGRRLSNENGKENGNEKS